MTAPHSKKFANASVAGIPCGGTLRPGSQEKFRSVEAAERNVQWAIAAAVESVYRVELKTADPDPGLLAGDDAGEARR